jgi:hypothetical protein
VKPSSHHDGAPRGAAAPTRRAIRSRARHE